MMLFRPGGQRVITTDEKLGEGALGEVWGIEGTNDVCAKLFIASPEDSERRLEALKQHPACQLLRGDHAEHVHVAWPLDRLVDRAGTTCGFVMPRVEGQRLVRLFDPDVRAGTVDEPTWRVMLTVASRAARLLDTLHRNGIVVGDVSPNNLMVTRTGHVTLIDCDEVQFTGVDGVAYACPKRSPEHAPPEISAGAGWLDPSHDLFGLTILIVQLLMEGEHPFVGVPADQNMGDVSVVKNIRLQNNRITHPERFVTSSADIPLAVLPPRIRELAVQCFGPGHRDPAARPAALTWSEELDTAAWQLMGCRFNDRHVYHNSLTTCVWCELLAAGAGERYPSAMAAAVPHSGVPAQPMPVFGPTPVATPPLPGQRQPHQPVKPATATSPTWLVVVGLIVLLFIIIAVVTHT